MVVLPDGPLGVSTSFLREFKHFHIDSKRLKALSVEDCYEKIVIPRTAEVNSSYATLKHSFANSRCLVYSGPCNVLVLHSGQQEVGEMLQLIVDWSSRQPTGAAHYFYMEMFSQNPNQTEASLRCIDELKCCFKSSSFHVLVIVDDVSRPFFCKCAVSAYLLLRAVQSRGARVEYLITKGAQHRMLRSLQGYSALHRVVDYLRLPTRASRRAGGAEHLAMRKLRSCDVQLVKESFRDWIVDICRRKISPSFHTNSASDAEVTIAYNVTSFLHASNAFPESRPFLKLLSSHLESSSVKDDLHARILMARAENYLVKDQPLKTLSLCKQAEALLDINWSNRDTEKLFWLLSRGYAEIKELGSAIRWSLELVRCKRALLSAHPPLKLTQQQQIQAPRPEALSRATRHYKDCLQEETANIAETIELAEYTFDLAQLFLQFQEYKKSQEEFRNAFNLYMLVYGKVDPLCYKCRTKIQEISHLLDEQTLATENI